MNLFPTFGFNGLVLPFIDKTDRLYLLVDNKNNHRVLLNVVSSDFNKFINIDANSSKIIQSGTYKTGFQLKMFYLGQELFDFNCDEIDKNHLSIYSNYILTKETGVGNVSFSLSTENGLLLTTESDKPQILYIQIIDVDHNEIIHEDVFISNEPYKFKLDRFQRFGICVYNENGQKIYNYHQNEKEILTDNTI